MNLRRSCLVALSVMSLMLMAPRNVPAYEYSYARVVRLSLVDGDVQVAKPSAQNDDKSDSGWEQAVVNLPIQQGYTLATGSGRAEVEFESGATARLAENSVLRFTELALSDGGRRTQLTLTQGTATFYANLSHDDSFVVATPHLQVVIPESARFRVDVSEESTQVSALKGEVEVDSRAGTNRLTKGYSLDYRTSEPDRVAIDHALKTDDWDHWVADRDEVIQTGNTAALQYVNSPYTYGLSDLSSYGNWYPLAGYGLCWQPYGAGLNWFPYGSGRWVFFSGLGWTWLSREPWGWMPYHFGRWVFAPTLGWLWVPSHFNHWQPALVTWVRIRDRVGWVPLHPNDRLGQLPTNLAQGFVVHTPNPPQGSQRLELVTVNRRDRAQMIQGPPADLAGARAHASGALPSKTPSAGTPGSSHEQPGIVFDQKERRFVNNPNGARLQEDKPSEAVTGTERTSAPLRPSVVVQPKPPARPPAAGRAVLPHQVSGPPRVQPAPQPRTERPAMHSQPAPPPRAPHMEPAPGPSPPPASHSEHSHGGASRR